MIRTIDFWILFCAKSLLMGSGIAWINNVGLMARALVLKNNPNPNEEENLKWQLLQVSTLSVASCIGRLLIGVTADFAKHKGLRSARLISGIAATFFISQLVGIIVQDVEYLQFPVFLVGISFGGTVGLVSIIVIEWFGTAHASENIGIFVLAPILMGNVLSMIFGRVFDAHSTPSEHGMRCFEGAQCYSASLYVTAFACFCALILAFVAVRRDGKYR